MTTLPKTTARKLAEHLRHFVDRAVVPRRRSMRQFAEQDINIPDGPHQGRFKCKTQPWSRLWFDAIDSGRWNRFVHTGPGQGGKSLSGYVIPSLYHLFEIGETVICGVPHMDMAFDKWKRDFEPIIGASRYAEFLPRQGRGSRGGTFSAIQFRNGATLRFMTGGGDDKTRAGFTSRVVAITEVDGLDEVAEKSREADPLKQIEARTRAYGDNKRIYMECTVSIEQGRIWQEYQGGTASQIILRCPHCDGWSTPSRDDFHGWQEAETELQARASAAFFCPLCGEQWSDGDRRQANLAAQLIHRGQTVDAAGVVTGEPPETMTLGFRWSAPNNMFATNRQLGGEEWQAARAFDIENAQKERQQFVWCVPWAGQPADVEINEQIIANRLSGLPRGEVPANATSLVVHIDLHMRWHYWTALAAAPDRVYNIVDYGIFHTPNPAVNGPEIAVALGLEQLAGELLGKNFHTAGTKRPIDLVLIDAGYQQDAALEFVTSMGPTWQLHKGEGEDYRPPRSPKEHDWKWHQTHFVADHWHRSQQPANEHSEHKKWWLHFGEKWYWMHRVHGGLASSPFLDDETTRRPGSIVLFGDDPQLHLQPLDRTVNRSAFATQLMAWKWQETVTPKKGQTMAWVSQHKDDHWFDTTYGTLVAAAIHTAGPAGHAPARRSVEIPAHLKKGGA